VTDKEIKGKIKEIVDNPGNAIEIGLKKSWDNTKNFGKDIKNTITKKVKEKEERVEENYEHKRPRTLMMSQKGMK